MPTTPQLRLDLESLSPAAVVARDALIAALDGGPEVVDLDPAIFDELDDAGVLDEIARMEEAEGVDWADPDAHDLDTLRWYDESAVRPTDVLIPRDLAERLACRHVRIDRLREHIDLPHPPRVR